VVPTRGNRSDDVLVDTSVAVALVVADHVHHQRALAALRRRRLGLAGHAAFETYSVLTRLPAPARRPPSIVAQIIRANFPATRFLSAQRARQLLMGLAEERVTGGAVYDALVGAVAAEHGLTLATLDHRALDTYRAVGARVEITGRP
jgi:predicted nucleic acid-binding protein